MQPLSHALQAWKSSNTALLTVVIFRDSLFAHIIIYRKYIATRLILPRWLNIMIKHYYYYFYIQKSLQYVQLMCMAFFFFLTHWIQISRPINIRTNPKSVLKAALIFLKNMFGYFTKITEIYKKRVNPLLLSRSFWASFHARIQNTDWRLQWPTLTAECCPQVNSNQYKTSAFPRLHGRGGAQLFL